MAITLLRSRSRMVALVAGFCLLVMLMVSNIAPAVAGPAFSVEKYYYSDASMTKQVGMSFLSCSGSFHTTGKITSYYVRIEDSCN